MARADIGEILHAPCGKVAPVRKNANGKLYINCPRCGMGTYVLPAGQDYILANAKMFGPDGKPEEAPTPAPAAKVSAQQAAPTPTPTPAPKPAPAPQPKKEEPKKDTGWTIL